MPDAASVHVLYAGNLADDDFMWIVECTVEEFQKMLGNPTQWVANLATLPDWPYASVQVKGKVENSTSLRTSMATAFALSAPAPVTPRQPAPAPVLLPHFTMRVVQRQRESASGLITIQGISHTGIVTVRTSQASAVEGVRNLRAFREQRRAVALNVGDGAAEAGGLAPATLEGFWDEMAYDPDNAPTYKKELAINVDTTDDRYYAHFEITQPGELSAEELLAKAAAFVLAYGSDPQGFTNMLNGLDQTTLYITPNGVVPGKPITLNVNSDAPPPLLYTNPGDTGDSCCNMLDGAYDDDSSIGLVDNPVVKRYGIG